MTSGPTCRRYHPFTRLFEPGQAVDEVLFTGPTGKRVRAAYDHLPADLIYDEHGYETIRITGSRCRAVRVCLDVPGTWRWRAITCGHEVTSGHVECVDDAHPGYVEVSNKDSRYFAFSNGASYVPIGTNLCFPPYYALPTGDEHFATSDRLATLGCKDYQRWFRHLHDAGANFARLYLSQPYFEAETVTAGELQIERYACLQRAVDLARQYGIRLKMCLEHWRWIGDQPQSVETVWSRDLRHPDTGRRPGNTTEWFESDMWQNLWWKKVDALLARFGDDPTIMAWELWNEINCCRADWPVVSAWTRRTLSRLKEKVPCQLVTNSVGSYDNEDVNVAYNDFRTMDAIDFQQVHRYLDQGAPYELCRTSPPDFTQDAIRAARRDDKPVLLAETGAVNDRHTGPHRYCRADHRGTLLHDHTYPAFFAGAAGPGHSWWWIEYIDHKNIWYQYRALADLLDGVEVDSEGFEPIDLSTESTWFLALAGRRHTLVWVRNKADSWERALLDDLAPPSLADSSWDLSALGLGPGTVELYWPWRDGSEPGAFVSGVLSLPACAYGLLAKISSKRT